MGKLYGSGVIEFELGGIVVPKCYNHLSGDRFYTWDFIRSRL